MKKFKTESQRLLDLVINSIYTNKEIFLRELISNASDAIDKLYFLSLTDKSLSLSRDSLAVRLTPNKPERTLTISDNGIGMTSEDLEKNLGTIAHSGSLDFLSSNNTAEGTADIDIIGQFGVGFYSAFMVASKVQVISRAHNSEEAFVWESDGKAGYTVNKAQRSEPGTDVILYIKEDSEVADYSDYLNGYTLRELVKRYSNYVRYPIQMEVEHHRAKPKPADAPEDYQVEYEDVLELETLNSMTPIWKRSKKDVSDAEYNEFFKSEFHEFSDPRRRISLHAEGALTYDALLFIPGHAPYDLYSRDYKGGLALYTANVLIMERCEELLPDCFNFVRGVVDSPDLTLNISRETLQQNHQLHAIAKRVEKRIKQDLAAFCAEDRPGYEGFFSDFGRTLKYGIYSSYGQNRELLADLLLYYSAQQEKMVTLDEYLASLPDEQEAIYYAVGDSLDRLKKLPVVTSALARGYDVLLGDSEIDEFALTMLREYTSKTISDNTSEIKAKAATGESNTADASDASSDATSEADKTNISTEAANKEKEPRSYPLKNITSEDVSLGSEEEKAQAEQTGKDNQRLFEAMTQALDGAVEKVVVSTRLTDAPVCITSEGPVSLEMEKVISKMPGANEEVKAGRVLEINAGHPVFAKLQDALTNDRGDELARYTKVLYGQALLIEGLPLDDPIAYAQEICELL